MEKKQSQQQQAIDQHDNHLLFTSTSTGTSLSALSLRAPQQDSRSSTSTTNCFSFHDSHHHMRSKYFTRTSTTACGGGGDCCSVIHHHKKEGSIPSVATNRCVCRGGDPGAESSTLLLDSTASRKDQMKNTNVRLHVTHKEMSRYFNASQITAARLLGVSISTLKRRYKEVSNGSRWPYLKLSTSEKKKSIWFYINDEDENEKSISKECQLVLAKAFQNCTLPSTFYFSDLRKQDRRVIFYKYIPEHSNTTNQSTLTH